MTCRRRAIVASALSAIFLCLTAHVSEAAVGATLASLSVSQLNPNVVRAQLDFVPQTPQYRIDGTGTRRIAIQFFATTKRPGLNSISGGAAMIRGIDIVQSGTTVTLVVTADDPLSVNVTPAPQSFVVFLSIDDKSRTAPAVTAPSSSAVEVSMLRLKYADVNEVAGLLGAANLADPFGGLTSGPQFNGSPLGNGLGGLNAGQSLTTLPTQQLSSLPQAGIRISDVVSIDRRLNAVILSGSASVTEPLKKLIGLVDTPVSSVFLEVSVVELTESAARDVGIDFSSGGSLASAALSAKSFSQPSGTVSLQSAIYGQVQKGQGRIIARPTVLAQSGTPASINTGDAIPIFTNIAFPATGSTIVQQQVQYVNVGVNLQIVATVDVDNGVHARVIANVSSVTGFVQGVPQISQRQASTLADLKDRQSLVIGGLVQENELNNSARVPVLSSIPVVGGLFRVRHDRSQRTFLYIVITPTLLTRTGT
jgi:general secretion pathway protein D